MCLGNFKRKVKIYNRIRVLQFLSETSQFLLNGLHFWSHWVDFDPFFCMKNVKKYWVLNFDRFNYSFWSKIWLMSGFLTQILKITGGHVFARLAYIPYTWIFPEIFHEFFLLYSAILPFCRRIDAFFEAIFEQTREITWIQMSKIEHNEWKKNTADSFWSCAYRTYECVQIVTNFNQFIRWFWCGHHFISLICCCAFFLILNFKFLLADNISSFFILCWRLAANIKLKEKTAKNSDYELFIVYVPSLYFR